jgi:hypothetical protein
MIYRKAESGILHTSCAGFSKHETGIPPGARYRVPGIGYRAIWHLEPGTRHRSQSDAEGRTPSTEDQAWPSENAHTGFA